MDMVRVRVCTLLYWLIFSFAWLAESDMVLNNKKLGHVLAAIAAIGAKAEEVALQPVVGVKVDANGNGVEEVGGHFRRLKAIMMSMIPTEEEYLLVKNTGEIETELEEETRLEDEENVKRLKTAVKEAKEKKDGIGPRLETPIKLIKSFRIPMKRRRRTRNLKYSKMHTTLP